MKSQSVSFRSEMDLLGIGARPLIVVLWLCLNTVARGSSSSNEHSDASCGGSPFSSLVSAPGVQKTTISERCGMQAPWLKEWDVAFRVHVVERMKISTALGPHILNDSNLLIFLDK